MKREKIARKFSNVINFKFLKKNIRIIIGIIVSFLGKFYLFQKKIRFRKTYRICIDIFVENIFGKTKVDTEKHRLIKFINRLNYKQFKRKRALFRTPGIDPPKLLHEYII